MSLLTPWEEAPRRVGHAEAFHREHRDHARCLRVGRQRFRAGGPHAAGELRIADKSPRNYQYVVLNVFEHLIELDKDGQLVPGLATGWQWLDDRTLEVKLRQGVKFHNGEVFDGEIVKLNWEENLRLKQPFVSGEFMNFKRGSRLELIDPETVRLTLSRTRWRSAGEALPAAYRQSSVPC